MCGHRKHKGGMGWMLGGGIFAAFFGAFILKLLWNALIPALFGLPFIGFFQALGLLMLSRILFGGRRHHRGGMRGYKKWKAKFREKMEAMTPEERAKFKEGFMGRGWDVNVFDVEEPENREEEGEDSDDEKPSDKNS